MTTTDEQNGLIELTADIVSAYVSKNSVAANEVPALIGEVFSALSRAGTGAVAAPVEPAKPAVSPKKSITPDYLICLEDGKKFKSLKRHLRTMYNMSRSNIARSGALPPITRWSLPTMPRRGLASRRRWASASSANAQRVAEGEGFRRGPDLAPAISSAA